MSPEAVRTYWRCGVCGEVYENRDAIMGHVGGRMETNGGDHPRWDELEVSPGDLNAWADIAPNGVANGGPPLAAGPEQRLRVPAALVEHR